MRAIPIPIDWNPSFPIFASPSFLKTAGDAFGWLGGFDEGGSLRCMLPYTVTRRAFLRMARFRVETLALGQSLGVDEEKAFLESALDYFRSSGVDLVIPATANAVFLTYPNTADAAPYGTCRIDLPQPEETLWHNLHSKHRNVIRNAINKGVVIREGLEYLPVVHRLVKETLWRSRMGWMSLRAFQQMVCALGENIKLLVAESGGVIQSCAAIPFSQHGAYYLFGGGIPHPLTGSMNLLHWDAIRRFRALGVKRYDFMGVRIRPEKGSKDAGLALFKERFGGELVQGYLWKAALRPLSGALYAAAARLRSGGDVVDKERHKLNGNPS